MNSKREMLLTGGTGFLGRHLVPLLVPHYAVTTLSRRPEADIRCDLTADVPALPRRYDTVVHAAGYAHPQGRPSLDRFRAVNVEGTRRLLVALERAGLPRRLVFISSVAVYGLGSGEYIDETFPATPCTPYGQSKLEAERLLERWCAANGVSLTVLRLPLVFGYDAPGNLRAMTRAIRRGYYFTVGRGAGRRTIVSPEDVARSIIGCPEGTFNVAPPEAVTTVGEVARRIARHFGVPAPRRIPHPLAFVTALIGSVIPRFPLTLSRLRRLTATLTFSSKYSPQIRR